MSYSTHKRQALDAAEPLSHRASHARSCANHVAEKLNVHRDGVIECVKHSTGIDLRVIGSDEELRRAMACLDGLRRPGVRPDTLGCGGVPRIVSDSTQPNNS